MAAASNSTWEYGIRLTRSTNDRSALHPLLPPKDDLPWSRMLLGQCEKGSLELEAR